MTKEKKPIGRPTLFSERLAERALRLAEDGGTDQQIASALGIGFNTFMAWKGRYEDFRVALKEKKELADELVEASLFQRAIGYSHVTAKKVKRDGEWTMEDIVENFPPDTTAAIFWLKNRQPNRWRDRHEVAHSAISDHDEELSKQDQEKLTELFSTVK